MFLGSESQVPFVCVRLNIRLGRLVLAYDISFSAAFSASDLRKAPFAYKAPPS